MALSDLSKTPTGPKFYLAGPMSGIVGFNYKAFEEAAAHFRTNRNFDILSPHEVDNGSTHKPYSFYIRRALGLLTQADAIILLPGWENSRGATLEENIAHLCDMHIFKIADRSYRLIRARGRGNQDATGFPVQG